MLPNYTFFLDRPNSESPTSIKMRFYFRGKRFVYGTGLTIFSKHWDSQKQRPITILKQAERSLTKDPQIKDKLKNIATRIELICIEVNKYFMLKAYDQCEINFKDLQMTLKNIFNSEPKTSKYVNPKIEQSVVIPTISEIFHNYIKHIEDGSKTIQTPSSKRGQRYSYRLTQSYKSTEKVFIEFEESINKNFLINEISKNFASQLLHFFNSQKRYTPGTKGKHIKLLKVVIHDFIDETRHSIFENKLHPENNILTIDDLFHIESELKSITKPSFSSTKIYLKESEIKKIQELDLSKWSYLLKARDIFLCGYFTALRHSDYSRISEEHIKNNLLEIHLEKTKNLVRIPIKPALKNILEKV